MTLVYLSIAWACGIWLAHLFWSQGALSCAVPAWPFLLVGGAVAGCAVALRSRPQAARAAVLLVFLLLGVARYQSQPFAACPTPTDLAFYNDRLRGVTVEGVVAAYPDLRDVTAQYELVAERITVDGVTRAIRGRVLVQEPRFPAYRYGDRLRVTGRLETPPQLDDFDYAAYLAQRGIHSLLRRGEITLLAAGQGHPLRAALYRVRSDASALLNRLLPEPAASLANGILLGIESNIPKELDDAFVRTGVSHIIVISGSNMALFAGLFMAALSRWIGKRRAAPLALLLVVLYVLLAGDGPAAQRAGLMSGLFILATYLGRHSTAYVSLCAAGLAMTAVNPLTLWDTGFRLSFLATLGMILFTRPLTRALHACLARWLPAASLKPGLGLLNSAVVVTLAAQALTLPLIVAVFGRLSLVSLIANALVLPVQPFVMTGGLAALLGGALWEPLGRVLAVMPWLGLSYTVAVVRGLAAIPFASIEIGQAGRMLALLPYLGLLAYGAARLLRSRGWRMRPSRRVAAWTMGLLAPVALLVGALAARPDGRLHVRYVMAGESEAALIVTPGGQRVWVWDGQGDTVRLARATGGRVDVAIGPDATALWPEATPVDPRDMPPGATIRLDHDVTLTRLDAGDAWALRLAYRDFSVLLPAPLAPDAQTALAANTPVNSLHSTVLKAPVAGTGAWPTVEFLTLVAAQTVFWPEETTYPPDVEAWLKDTGAVRVPAAGIVEVTTDGARYQVESGAGQ